MISRQRSNGNGRPPATTDPAIELDQIAAEIAKVERAGEPLEARLEAARRELAADLQLFIERGWDPAPGGLSE